MPIEQAGLPTQLNKTRPPANGAYYTASVLYNAGFRGWPLTIMTAIAGRESSWNPTALNNNPATSDYSVGLFQINYFGSLLSGRTQSFGSPASLQSNPQEQANAAYQLAGGNSLSGLGNWNMSASPANGVVPTPLSAPGTYDIARFMPQALAASSAVGTFGPAQAASTGQVSGWPKGGGPSVTAGGYQTASLTSANMGATNGCTGDAIDLKITSITKCQLKGLLGGTIMVAGGLMALVGVGVLTVSLFGRRSNPLADLASAGVGFVAGRRSEARQAKEESLTPPSGSQTQGAAQTRSYSAEEAYFPNEE